MPLWLGGVGGMRALCWSGGVGGIRIPPTFWSGGVGGMRAVTVKWDSRKLCSGGVGGTRMTVCCGGVGGTCRGERGGVDGITSPQNKKLL